MSHLATNLDKILDLHENNERGEYGKGNLFFNFENNRE